MRKERVEGTGCGEQEFAEYLNCKPHRIDVIYLDRRTERKKAS